jgi:hypothetical protein
LAHKKQLSVTTKHFMECTGGGGGVEAQFYTFWN